MQVLSQAYLHVHNEGETLGAESDRALHVFVVLRGCVRIHYLDGNSYLAGAPSRASCPA